MCRYCTCSSCRRCDRKCRRISCWVSDGQIVVRCYCSHNTHAYELACSCCSPYRRVRELQIVYGDNQLTCFRNTHLKQYLIGPYRNQRKVCGIHSYNICSEGGAILGKFYVFTDADSRCIVAGHQGIKIGVGHNSICACWAYGPSCTCICCNPWRAS